ncbi:hypothetical protein, partial [Phenylobacterium sp.]|uniref:hypothetical protein n=1 Tax=Phenylobacterium sp. TaxID=1871053 RepID=UPI0025DAE132
ALSYCENRRRAQREQSATTDPVRVSAVPHLFDVRRRMTLRPKRNGAPQEGAAASIVEQRAI